MLSSDRPLNYGYKIRGNNRKMDKMAASVRLPNYGCETDSI